MKSAFLRMLALSEARFGIARRSANSPDDFGFVRGSVGANFVAHFSGCLSVNRRKCAQPDHEDSECRATFAICLLMRKGNQRLSFYKELPAAHDLFAINPNIEFPSNNIDVG